MKYIQRRNKQYHFRFRTPLHLNSIGSIPSEITKSLKTDSYVIACAKVSAKLPLISRIKNMKDTSCLSELFNELTNFDDIDSKSASYRDKHRNDYQYDWYSFHERDVGSSLQNGGGFDFSDVTSTQPNTEDKALIRDFERLYLRLVEARTERFYNGTTEQFDYLIERANSLLPQQGDTLSNSDNKPPYLLSQAWSDYTKTKSWTSTKGREFQRHYEFMSAYFGDTDVRGLTKQDLRASLNRYCELPKVDRKPYYQWSMDKLIKVKPEEVKPEQRIKESTAIAYLKTMQGFFNQFLFKANDIYKTSPTDGISMDVDDCRYGVYTDEEIQKFEQFALSAKEPYQKWVILLAIYTGARLSEICTFLEQGHQTDEATGIHYFFLKEGKSKHAIRAVPIHPKLIENSILEQTQVTIKAGSISKDFNKWREQLSISKQDGDGYDKVFHSFRHTFITKCYDKGVQQDLIQTVVGHSKNSGITNRYNHSQSLKQLKLLHDEVILKVNYYK
ncbi:tyrosine-type recombinase/integrase [Photobacterium ganghwense]|uniref:tyrosine-type recombinase/integrase n=1 Tax=Photobacterium ganghwense TaxID=320778 RepID=UPI001A8F7D09|nr:tyrosine-type recombinase/integrase [Photobacterium ganghwense]QSV13415.1 tyrosine-type recombinase/integrase [Photobacterium ganghwense]